MMSNKSWEPLVGDGVQIRLARLGDEVPLAARRSDPEVSKHQGWPVPYTLEAATRLVGELVTELTPVDDQWWMGMIADEADTVVYGDVALKPSFGNRVYELGYTLAREHWGKGIGTRTVAMLCDHLLAEGAQRIQAQIFPDNLASMRLVERLGFVYEGRTANSYIPEPNEDHQPVTHPESGTSDDVIYGLTPQRRADWLGRSQTPAGTVELVEVTNANYRQVRELETHYSQRRFVSPTLFSFTDAMYPDTHEGSPVTPIVRAVVADGEPVGFTMIAASTGHHDEPYLWRLLIDRMHQRRGIGRKVLDRWVEHCRAAGDTSLLVSYVPGVESPQPFYEAYGFVATGKIEHGEHEARLTL